MSKSWCQFHQHFTHPFLPIFWRQKLQSGNVWLVIFWVQNIGKKMLFSKHFPPINHLIYNVLLYKDNCM